MVNCASFESSNNVHQMAGILHNQSSPPVPGGLIRWTAPLTVCLINVFLMKFCRTWLPFLYIHGLRSCRNTSLFRVMMVDLQKHYWSSQSSSHCVNSGRNKLQYIKEKGASEPKSIKPSTTIYLKKKKKRLSWTLGALWLCPFSLIRHPKDAAPIVVYWITNKMHFSPYCYFLEFVISWINVIYIPGLLQVLE